MCDLENDQAAENSSAADDTPVVQIAQVDMSFDVDMDPPGVLTDPPQTP
jgi:hypothetical protein